MLNTSGWKTIKIKNVFGTSLSARHYSGLRYYLSRPTNSLLTINYVVQNPYAVNSRSASHKIFRLNWESKALFSLSQKTANELDESISSTSTIPEIHSILPLHLQPYLQNDFLSLCSLTITSLYFRLPFVLHVLFISPSSI